MTIPLIFTICSRDRLADAAVLCDSLVQHAPASRRVLILAEQNAAETEITTLQTRLRAEVLPLSALGAPQQIRKLAFRYECHAFNAALKPWGFRHLFAQGHDAVCYVRPQARLTQALPDVLADLDVPALLMPHAPPPAGLPFDFGCLALGRSPQAGAFLDWWADQLLHLPLQMQQLAGQAPDEFPGAALPSWVPDCRMLPVGAPWLTWASDAGLRQQAEQSLPAARPYSFACYADGQPIDPAERLAYASFNDPDREAIVDPFDPATLVRLAAYREIDAASGSAAGLLYQVWRERDTVLRLQDQTQHLQDQAQQLQARLQEAQTHLAVLQGSRSYRLGRLLLAPLRLARSKGGGRLLQALRHMLARLRYHQRQHGWRATLGASVRYLRRKGWSGLRRDLALDLDPLSPLSGQWLRPDPPPLAAHEESVDVIVCIHNAPDDVRRCLAAVLEHTVQPYRLILVDDGSQPETAGLVSEFAAAHGIDPIRNETARGYTLAANQGLRASEADFAVLLNSDTIVTPDWLDRMLRCARSDARIAVVGPLSNTASWQSVPRIVGDDGDWCDNPLPDGRTPADMAGQVARVARPQYPRVGFLNGFCYMIRRVAREELGNFDEYTFARGFGEENDYSLRVLQAGWQLAVADDAYVFHAQSRSYSSERRHKLARLAGEALEKKHGQARIEQGLLHTRDNLVLAAMRARIAGCWDEQALIEQAVVRHRGRRVLFLLPIMMACGGGNVVIQEAKAMARMGIDARLVNLRHHQARFEHYHPGLDLPVDYIARPEDLDSLVAGADAIVATLYVTVRWIADSLRRTDDTRLVPAYYVQDFEPYFFAEGTSEHRLARESYALLPNLVRLTKTRWNQQEVRAQCGVESVVVGCSYDARLFLPWQPKQGAAPVRITAMIRPSTPWRSPAMTLRILKALSETLKDQARIRLFGVNDPDLAAAGLETGFTYDNRGPLPTEGVAALMDETDVFLDFSTYQAMGLTALEAMACGVAVVAPRKGGAGDFIHHEQNGLLVNTADESACLQAALRLATDHALRARLQQAALASAPRHTPERAAARMLDALFPG